MKLYEGMFLFDSSVVHDWASMEQEIRRLLDRISAELVICIKFDEQRKLAFEIRRRKRGTYVLTYFKAPPERIGELERDAHLSEVLLRHVVLRPEGLTDERLAELKAWPVEKPLLASMTENMRRDEGGGDRDRDRDRDHRDRDRDRDRGRGRGDRDEVLSMADVAEE